MNTKKVIKREIIVIGAGASGLMFTALNPDLDIGLVDINPKVGQKIKVSGGGKCNITNQKIFETNYLGNREFIKKVLKNTTYRDILDFFIGVEFVKRKGSQFFCKKSSSDIIDFFISKINPKKLYLSQKVTDVDFKNETFYVESDKSIFLSKKLVIASGGLSFKELGASDIGYKTAEKFGHTVISPNPALVGLTLQRDDFWMKKLSGVSLRVKIKVSDKEFTDDMLFTHKGISGPAVLNSSLYWSKGSIEIDFLPDKILEFSKRQKQISSNLPLPKRFVKEFLHYLGIKDKVVSELTADDLEKLNILKHYMLAPAGNFGYKRAEVTKGGINTDEVDPSNMQSKLQKGLYFLGECLDVTGELGGYNFHFAFSSARRINLKNT